MDHITHFVMSLVQNMGMLGYWVAFIAALAETVLVIGLILPGSTFLLLMGILSGQGVLDLGDLLFFAIAGATIGDNINYQLGKKYGQQWLQQGRWFLKAEYLSKAEGFFHKHGGKSVFLGRFVPSVKELMPFIAGMANMERWSFFFWNLLGAIGWSLQWILPGYIFSQSLALAQAWLTRVGILIVAAIALFALLYFIRWIILRFGARSWQLALSAGRSIIDALRHKPSVVCWCERHPRSALFIKQRLDTQHIRGLPITLIFVSMSYVALLFGGLIEDFLNKDSVFTYDVRINTLIASFRTPLVNHFFYGITTLGNPSVVILGLVVSSILLWHSRRARFILPMLFSAGFADLLTSLGKLAFHRARPDTAIIEQAGFSFPSGHATISIAFYGFLFFIVIHSVRGWRKHINLIFMAVMLASVIGFSRLYLGVHYLSDILAGYLVGGMGLLLGIALSLTHWRNSHRHFRFLDVLQKRSIIFAILGSLAWLGLFIGYNLHPAISTKLDAVPTDTIATATFDANPNILFKHPKSDQAISMIGERKASINLVFLAKPEDLQTCLRAAGWHAVQRANMTRLVQAYWDHFMNKPNPTAPLSPWFWQDNPQYQQWSQPDGNHRVFDRYFFRVWKTDYSAKSGLNVYVATTGHERLPTQHIVPIVDQTFDAARTRLVNQLSKAGGIVEQDTQASKIQDGNRIILQLGVCH